MKEKEFEKIYKDTYDYLLKFIVIKCYNISDVNDIIQDTYIELYKIMKKNKKQIQNMNSFICGIASNIIKRYYYKKNKLVLLSSNDDENDILNNISDEYNLEDNFINKDNVARVWKYIEAKDINTVKIFYLYFRFGEKIIDIANELNLSESNVKNKLYRTINEIKKKFNKEVDMYE